MSNFDLILLLTLVVLVGTLLAVIGVTVFHHFWTRRRIQQRAALAEEIRPQLMTLLLEDEPDLSLFETEQGLRSRMIDDLAEALIGKLRGADRERLVHLLDRRGALERARLQLSSRRAPVRARAVQLLGSTGAPGALPFLASSLHDPNRTVREVATRSIGRLADPAATGPLLALLATEDRPVPEHLVRMALFRLGRPAIPELIGELGHRSPAVRRCAADVLGHLGAMEAIRPLADLAQSDEDHEAAVIAVAAIDRIDGPATADTLRRLAVESSIPEARDLAAAGVARRSPPGADVAAAAADAGADGGANNGASDDVVDSVGSELAVGNG